VYNGCIEIVEKVHLVVIAMAGCSPSQTSSRCSFGKQSPDFATMLPRPVEGTPLSQRHLKRKRLIFNTLLYYWLIGVKRKDKSMIAQSIENVLKQAARLTPAERLTLASRLIEGVKQEIPVKNEKPLKWRHLRGMLPDPAFGEDAQAYISRTRREDTAQRDRQLNHDL
jgi:hypothetical protein